jgi:hypothetical protein
MFRTLILFAGLLMSGLAAHSQEIAQIQFSGGSSISAIALLTDGNVLIRLNDEGKIMEWGTEEQSFRNNNYYAPRLQPYPGRIEYYGVEADSINRGKVKTIASAYITYYPATETEIKKGKVRSIGRSFFDYFDIYDNKTLRGKIKMIGGIAFQFYTNFDDPVLVGKLRSVGNTMIQYYTSFDDKLIRGKVKSIGPVSYTWYTSLETQYGTGIKTGPFRASVGGIMYILQ